MKTSTLLFSLFLSLSVFSQTKEKFSVTYNRNIETYFLAELFAVNYRRTNKSFEQYKKTECRKYQPLIAETLKTYGYLKNSKIAKLTAVLNDSLVSYGMGNDLLMAPLLYLKEFPTSDYNSGYKFISNRFSEETLTVINSIIKKYIKELGEFYKSENLQHLFKKYQKFYSGAIKEVSNLIPPKFTDAMEKFYGEKMLSYTELVSPMMMWPIEDNEGRGIGPSVITPAGTKVFEIMSPYVRVESNMKIDKYSTFGYNYKPRAMMLTIHEFGHSFVNKEVEKYIGRIKETDSLFTKSNLKAMMESKGVQSWEVYIIESIVRLGEIRVAELQDDKQRANDLRKYHINVEHFVFLPLLEEKIKLYEGDRKKYPKLADFLPELLTVFEETNIEFLNKKLAEQ